MEHGIELEALLRDAGWLRRLAARLVGEGGADDLAQETWLAALRRPPRSVEEPRPWLARVARNLAANARRGSARQAVREEQVHEERPERSPDELAQEAEAQRLVAEAVTRLQPPLRAAVVLCYYQGLDSRAAAERLGVPASTLRTRLQRALEELRAELDRKRGRESWMMLLAPLVRAPELVAVGSVGALTLAAVLGGVVLVGSLVYVAWPSASAEGEVQSAELVGPALLDTPSNEQGDEPHGLREALPTTTDEPAAPPMAEAATTARLSGTILIDGHPPEWPLELTLASQLPDTSAGPSAPLWHPSHPNVVLAPEERGRFSFNGLPPDWKGRLAVERFTFLDGTFARFFDAPAEDLVLHLSARPQIVGRLLEPDGSPAGGVEIAYRCSSEGGTLTSATKTLIDGRFRIFAGVANGHFDRAATGPSKKASDSSELALVADARARGWLQLETAPFERAHGLDLGDLVLEPVRTRAYSVRASDGSPIADAYVRIDAARSLCIYTGGTDEAGRGRFPIPERPCAMRVSAFGFADGLVTVAPADELEFVLAPLAMLSLTVSGDESALLLLRSARSLFVWDVEGWDEPGQEYQEDSGATHWNTLRPGDGERPWEYEYELDGPTTLTLVGLVPDQPFELELFDADGHSLAIHTARLATGERVALTLGQATTADR